MYVCGYGMTVCSGSQGIHRANLIIETRAPSELGVSGLKPGSGPGVMGWCRR
ncbi:hypothetical protein PspLS_06654 [Pyricularia sp. CBS 133598]|nr:hypothetical protein PspLS_06654 [Pyricularia sp. CBS 133598]